MKPARSTTALAFLTSLLVVIPACDRQDGSQRQQGGDATASEIIAAHTTGAVSTESPITIRFVQDFADPAQVGSVLPASPLTFEPAVFKAAHRRPRTRIFWHLDRRFYGETRGLHEMAILADPGKHVLTLVDEKGEQLRRRFTVLAKDENAPGDANAPRGRRAMGIDEDVKVTSNPSATRITRSGSAPRSVTNGTNVKPRSTLRGRQQDRLPQSTAVQSGGGFREDTADHDRAVSGDQGVYERIHARHAVIRWAARRGRLAAGRRLAEVRRAQPRNHGRG